MKKLITIIICMFSSVMIANADICGYGHEVEINNIRYCVSISEDNNPNEWTIDNFNVSFYNNTFFIAFNKNLLLEKENFNNQIKIDIAIADNAFSVGPNGEKIQSEFNFAKLLDEIIVIKDYDNFYEFESTYKIYENESCINKNELGNNRYLNCKLSTEIKPKIVINIIEGDSIVGPTNPDTATKCEEIKCVEPLTFVEYLQNDNILLGAIVLVPIILLAATVIFIIKYKKLKKNNKLP